MLLIPAPTPTSRIPMAITSATARKSLSPPLQTQTSRIQITTPSTMISSANLDPTPQTATASPTSIKDTPPSVGTGFPRLLSPRSTSMETRWEPMVSSSSAPSMGIAVAEIRLLKTPLPSQVTSPKFRPELDSAPSHPGSVITLELTTRSCWTKAKNLPALPTPEIFPAPQQLGISLK